MSGVLPKSKALIQIGDISGEAFLAHQICIKTAEYITGNKWVVAGIVFAAALICTVIWGKIFKIVRKTILSKKDCTMKQKAVFLDRDGTINVEKDYLYKIEDFQFLPGVIEALQLLQSSGYLLIIITNQSGIARGYYTEDDYAKLNNWMLGEMKRQRVDIAAVYYCPHHPAAKVGEYKVDCSCRKPKLGLYERAIADFDLDVDSCYAVGDKARDCSICGSTGCHGFLIADNEEKEVIEAVKAGEVRNVEYATDLKDAVKKIVAEGKARY